MLRGTYHDVPGNAVHLIHGAADKAPQRVAWTFGAHSEVTFQTALAVLTEPSGLGSVNYANGERQQWMLTRYYEEPGDENPAAD